MANYIAVARTDTDGYIAGYATLSNEAEAVQAVINMINEGDTLAFYVEEPSSGHIGIWVSNGSALTVGTERPDVLLAKILDAISVLEASITPRRMREHALGTGGTWLADVDALIAIERAKL